MRCDIVIWLILGIAGGLLVISRIGFKKVVDWRVGIGLTLVGLSLFVLATNFPELGVGFGIVGTLILAGAALMAVRQSAEQFRDDRLERKLAAIIAWAEDITRCETAAPLSPLPWDEIANFGKAEGKTGVELLVDYHHRNRKTNLIMRYQTLAMMGPRVLLMARQLDRRFGRDLWSQAKETSDKLKEHIDLGGKFIEGAMSDDEYGKRCQSLRASAVALLERAEQALDS